MTDEIAPNIPQPDQNDPQPSPNNTHHNIGVPKPTVPTKYHDSESEHQDV